MSSPAMQTSTSYSMRPYQQEGVTYLLNHPRSLLLWPMGSGKTRTVLAAIRSVRLFEPPEPVLIVAPKGVAVVQRVWEAEAAEMGLDLTFHVLHGRGLRTLPLPVPDVFITTYDALHTPVIQGLLKSGICGTYVFDEISWLKSYSRRTRSVITHMRKHPAARVWGLTGTPAPNGLRDLFYQVQILDPSIWGRNKEKWTLDYFAPDNAYTPHPKWLPVDEERIYADLRPIASRVTGPELPPVMPQMIQVPMNPQQALVYTQMEKEFIVRVKSGDIVAANAAVQSGKLRQIASGFIYDEDGETHRHSNNRLLALEHLIKELQGQPLIVAYDFKADRNAIMARIPGAEELSADAVKRWNARDMEGPLVLHPKSAGHGLNLQHGGHHICWFNLVWSLELWEQLNARLARPGQANDYVSAHVFTSGGIEARVFESLCLKGATQDALLNALL